MRTHDGLYVLLCILVCLSVPSKLYFNEKWGFSTLSHTSGEGKVMWSSEELFCSNRTIPKLRCKKRSPRNTTCSNLIFYLFSVKTSRHQAEIDASFSTIPVVLNSPSSWNLYASYSWRLNSTLSILKCTVVKLLKHKSYAWNVPHDRRIICLLICLLKLFKK